MINGTVSTRFKLVSPRYNQTCLAYDFTYEEMQIYRKPDLGYSKDEWLKANRKAGSSSLHDKLFINQTMV